MLILPMAFMLVVTIVSLIQTIIANLPIGKPEGWQMDVWNGARAVIGTLLVVLAIELAVEGCRTLFGKKKA